MTSDLSEGKYDGPCEAIQKQFAARGVLLIVLDGSKGSGFSAAVTREVKAVIPSILRDVANQIEAQEP